MIPQADSATSHLAPGGYLEQAEINPHPMSDDHSVLPGTPLHDAGQLAIKCGDAFGKSLMIEETMEDDIRRAGFIEVVKTTYKWPIGAWGNDPRLKELGRWNGLHWNEGLEGWTLRFCTKYLGVCILSSCRHCLWFNTIGWAKQLTCLVDIRCCEEVECRHAENVERPKIPCLPKHVRPVIPMEQCLSE